MKRKETCDDTWYGKTWMRLRPCKKLQVNSNLVDRISELPDGILIDILSQLSLKEAGRSSVLSHRWRHLWKSTKRLNFDAKKLPFASARKRAVQRSRYVTWVNEVLKLHECPALEEFRVKFDLDISVCRHDIDNWIKFLIQKSVKVLEINLRSYWSSEVYTLSQECYNYFRSISNLNSIKCLKSISLDFLNVNGELLEYLLNECLHLDTLAVSYSKDLISLKVTSRSLRYLKLFRCDLSIVELCSPNLVKFEYFGATPEFRIGNNPCLANLSLGGGCGEKAVDAFVPFSDHLSQLETLQIKVYLEQEDVEIPKISQLRNLKHLALDIFVTDCTSILDFSDIVAAAPCLNKVTLELSTGFNYYSRSILPLPKKPHESLKVVELNGFLGCYSDYEFAAYLLKNAINLEKLVIHPYQPDETETRKQVEKKAKKNTRLCSQAEEKITSWGGINYLVAPWGWNNY